VVTVQTGQLTIENVCVCSSWLVQRVCGHSSNWTIDHWECVCVCSSWLVQRVSGHSSGWTTDHWECVCVFQLTSPEGQWSQFKLDNWPLRMCVCVLQVSVADTDSCSQVQLVYIWVPVITVLCCYSTMWPLPGGAWLDMVWCLDGSCSMDGLDSCIFETSENWYHCVTLPKLVRDRECQTC